MTACAGLIPSLSAVAQDAYPSKTITWIAPSGLGTPGDVTARLLAEHMSASMKQPIVVENRPGAAGTVGTNELLNRPADGYTLMMLGGPYMLIAPLLYPTRSFDFLHTLEPVGNTHWGYNVLVTSPDSGLTRPADIVNRSKAAPHSQSFASGGPGTPAHLAGALLNARTGIQATHVPYYQLPLALADIMAGRVSYMFLTTAAAIPQVQGGKLRALAVTSPHRLAQLPDTPTMLELGYSNFMLRSIEGVVVKAGTPPQIVALLNQELNKALAQAAIRERFSALGWEIEAMQPGRFRDVLAAETDKALRLARDAGVGPQ